MPYPVIICDNTTNLKEQTLVTNLKDYLGRKNINVGICKPNPSDTRTKQLLQDAQWLVLVLTPEAIKSPWLQSVVNFGFDRVKQGQMQGVLALAFSSNPVDPDDMPSPLWSTIRIYYTGDSEEEDQRAFEKLARTLGYSRVPILAHAQSTPADNWASSSGTLESAGSPPLPAYPTPIRKRRPPFIAAVMIVIALLFIVGATTLGINFFKRTSSTPRVFSTPTQRNARVTPTSSATLAASALTATALSKIATPTPTPLQLYTSVTTSTTPILNDPLDQTTLQDNKHKWDTNKCVFRDGSYYVPAAPGLDTTCLARNTAYTTNFAYQVQLIFSSGIAGGLVFLSNDAVSAFYRFSLDRAGKLVISMCQNCPDTTRATIDNIPSTENQITPGKAYYTLTVIVINLIIYIYVDGKLVGHVENSLKGRGGEIGVFAPSETKPNEVAFNDAKVWNF